MIFTAKNCGSGLDNDGYENGLGNANNGNCGDDVVFIQYLPASRLL
jgi:hypothetical protein